MISLPMVTANVGPPPLRSLAKLGNFLAWETGEKWGDPKIAPDHVLNLFSVYFPEEERIYEIWVFLGPFLMLRAPKIAQSQSLAISALSVPNRQKSRRNKGFRAQKSQPKSQIASDFPSHP